MYMHAHVERIPSISSFLVSQLGSLVFDPLKGDENNVYVGTGKAWSVAQTSRELDAKADRREFSLLWDAWTVMLDDGLTQ